MTIDQLQSLALAGESELVEFKKSTGERREACQTLCAMLNHRGGRVVIGVDRDGRVVGQNVVDKSLEDVAQEIKEIDPPVFPTIDRIPVQNHLEALVITISQGQGRPYSIRGRSFKRVGTTTQEMSRDEYNRMLLERMHGESRWENQPTDGWTIDDLDTTEIVRTVEEAIRRGRSEDPGTRDPRDLLRALGLIRDETLLRAAPMLFGKARKLEAEFPQCLLRVAKFRGTDKTEFVDNRQFHDNAFGLLLRAEQFLRDTLPIAGRIIPGVFAREDSPLYPPAALREALSNAICHRDYSIGGGSVAVAVYDDRLEITSSGTLHFGLTAADLFVAHESLPWNPLIARTFHRRGIIESWGRGTLKIAELMRSADQPIPQIEEASGCVVLRFHPSRNIHPDLSDHALSERQKQILELLREGGGLALRDFRTALESVSEWNIQRDLTRLRKLGLIDLHGKGGSSVWFLIG